MVNDMVLNDAVEKMAPNEAKIAIDSGQCTLDKSPMLGLEMRNIYMGVVQIGDSNWKCLLVLHWQRNSRS